VIALRKAVGHKLSNYRLKFFEKGAQEIRALISLYTYIMFSDTTTDCPIFVELFTNIVTVPNLGYFTK
jgi:hypothetical protein